MDYKAYSFFFPNNRCYCTSEQQCTNLCNIEVQIAFLEEFDHAHAMQFWPGARVSKVPKALRSRKVIRKTPTRLICVAGLLTCRKGIKIKVTAKFRASRRLRFEDRKRIVTRNAPEKSSGLSRNGHQEPNILLILQA